MAIAIWLVLIVVASVVFNFWSPWWFTPLASNWEQMDTTLIITLWITGVVFVAINFFIAYCCIRFRYKKERRAAYEPENVKLEWWLTILTSIGVIAMLAPGLFVYAKFINVPDDASVVEAVGQQWQWSYRFPGEDAVLGVVDPKLIGFRNPFGISPDDPNGQDDILVNSNEVHLPVGRPIKLLLRSKDVIHDFYVPNFRVKMDLVPGQITSLWFTPTKTGKYDVACAEYCGIGHHTMRGSVVVEEEEGFQAWLSGQSTFAETQASKAGGPDLDDPLVAQGQQIAEDQGCFGCHSVDGSPSVGPTWKGLFGKTETLVDGSTVEVDEEYLKESIVEPNATVPEGYSPIMPAYDLSDEELDALVAYTKALSSDSEGASSGDGSDEQGRLLAADQGCLGCHSVDGSQSVGPTWEGLFGSTRTMVDGNTAVADEDYLKESILDPNAMVTQGYSPMMPPYQVSEVELDALVEYIKGLSE